MAIAHHNTDDSAVEHELDELRRQVDMLRQQLRRSQRLAAIGTMTAMVAHEFNNILTPIISYAQMARGNAALAEKALLKTTEGGAKASAICRAILGLTRSDQEPVRTNIAQLVRQTLWAMAREPAKDGIELVLDIPADLECTLRPVAMEQVLLNLLVNARWAVMQSKGLRRIGVTAKTLDDHLVIEVSDNGVGITKPNIDRIFEPFFSTKQDAEGKEGFGLGLPICRELIEEMGGSIAVRSQPRRQTTFSIRLPLTIDE